MRRSNGKKPRRERKAERELFFWTAREAIKVGLSLALAIYLVLTLASGGNPVFRWVLTMI
jgi:hypothetical protein